MEAGSYLSVLKDLLVFLRDGNGEELEDMFQGTSEITVPIVYYFFDKILDTKLAVETIISVLKHSFTVSYDSRNHNCVWYEIYYNL